MRRVLNISLLFIGVVFLLAVFDQIPFVKTGSGSYFKTSEFVFVNDSLVFKPCSAEMYATNIAQAVVVPAADTFIQIGAGLTGGLTNLVTFQNAREFKITVAGKYRVWWSISPNFPSASNKEVEGAVMINGVTTGKSTAHCFVSAGGNNRPTSMSGSGDFNLVINDLISLALSNHTDGVDPVVEHLSCTILKIGN